MAQMHSLVSQTAQFNGDHARINHQARCGNVEPTTFWGLRENCDGFDLDICTLGYLSVAQFRRRCSLWDPELHELMSRELIIKPGATMLKWYGSGD
jgi:hypothetical protein